MKLKMLYKKDILRFIGVSFLFVSFLLEWISMIYAYPTGILRTDYNVTGEFLPELILWTLAFPICCFVVWDYIKRVMAKKK